MHVNCKVYLVILFSVCLGFFSQTVFAQNSKAVKSEIYSKLKCCACKESFEECSCAEAKEIKAYIDALLEGNINKEDILYKVGKKFSLKVIADKQTKESVEARLIKEAGGKRPQLVLDLTSFDFGKVNKKQGKVSKVFKFSNRGNQPLVITGIKTSCPCATVSLKVNEMRTAYFGTEGTPKDWQVEINPNKTGELELIVDLNSQHVETGKLIREAFVFSNDPIYPEVAVKIEAEVSK